MTEKASRGETNTSLIIAAVIIIAVVIVGFMWFSTQDDDTAVIVDEEETLGVPITDNDEAPVATPAATALTTSPAATATGSPAAGTVKTFAVAASNFKFTPAEIRVKQGETVRVTLTNDSPMPHDWRLDDFSVFTKVIAKGQTDTVEFVASKKGTFEYYCSVGNHRQQGMVGKLIVE